jgi:PTH1 family peptidyl-tRNA hydrolase
MNLSGGSVQPARDFYKLTNDQVLVVCDDFNLPLGKLRFRPKGSAGGQKGLADVIRRLGSEDIPRLRIGIGSPPPNWDVADFVLSRFSGEDAKVIKETVRRATDAVVEWVSRGTDHCMNQYNA